MMNIAVVSTIFFDNLTKGGNMSEFLSLTHISDRDKILAAILLEQPPRLNSLEINQILIAREIRLSESKKQEIIDETNGNAKTFYQHLKIKPADWWDSNPIGAFF